MMYCWHKLFEYKTNLHLDPRPSWIYANKKIARGSHLGIQVEFVQISHIGPYINTNQSKNFIGYNISGSFVEFAINHTRYAITARIQPRIIQNKMPQSMGWNRDFRYRRNSGATIRMRAGNTSYV